MVRWIVFRCSNTRKYNKIIMTGILRFLSIMIFISCSHQEVNHEKYIVVNNGYIYSVVNFKNDTILKLDSAKYFVCFDDTVENFLIVAPKTRKGWWAIDFDENYLFQVYNTIHGEPSPDEITNGRIRIVDEQGKIGFANEKGEIIIKPQFEQVTAFYKGFAIIGQDCRIIPWDTIHSVSDCHHYSISCLKNGYIDKDGIIIEIGSLTFDELWDKLDFPKE